MTSVVCPELVGRTQEWEYLAGALDRAGGGRGSLTYVTGEAGIGKSRLVAELCEVARQRRFGVLSGRAVDTGTPVTFRPLFEALSGWFRRGGPPQEPGLDVIRVALAQLVPEWRRPGEQAYRASPMELGEALLRLLTRIAGDRGCVLVLEDLHWADLDTVAVLEYIGDNLGTAPVLCLATLRSESATPALRVARALSARRSAAILELGRLSAAELARMTQLCLSTAALPDGVDETVRRFSDGLPFLVEELLASAVDAARVLVEAAVVGSRFLADLLPVVTGKPATTTTDALRRGIEAQLVVAEPDHPAMFGFRHALTRDALLAQMSPFERLEISRRALTALEVHDPALSGSACEAAAALAEAIGDGPNAARLLLLAARRAVARGALSSAAPMLERAWDWAAGREAARLEIGSLLMEVLTDGGQIDQALEVGNRLRAVPLPDADRAEVHLAIARAAATGTRWPIARSALAQVRREMPALSAVADGVEAEVAFGQDRFAEAATLAASSLALAQADGRPELACHALQVLGGCARFEGDLDAAERAFDAVIATAREHGLPRWRLRGLMERASLDAWRFLPPARAQAARAEAVEAGALVVAAHLDLFLALMARDRWDSDEADAAAARCADAGRRFRMASLVSIVTTVRAIAAAQRGDRDAMERWITEAQAANPAGVDTLAHSSAARANLALGRDDLTRAFAELQTCMSHHRRRRDTAGPARRTSLRRPRLPAAGRRARSRQLRGTAGPEAGHTARHPPPHLNHRDETHRRQPAPAAHHPRRLTRRVVLDAWCWMNVLTLHLVEAAQ